MHPDYGGAAVRDSSTRVNVLTTVAVGGWRIIFPSASLGFLFQPVENNGPSVKRGKGWASVLMTIFSKGSSSLGENRR